MKGKVNRDRWAAHLAAARGEGKTIAQYAVSRGLSRHTLYGASSAMGIDRRGKAVSLSPVARSEFAEVRVPALTMSSATRIEARLANGTSLAIESNEPAGELLLTALVALSGRR